MSENLARTEYPDIEGDEDYDPDWERLCNRKMGFNNNSLMLRKICTSTQLNDVTFMLVDCF